MKQKTLPKGWREVKIVDFSPLQRGFDLPADRIREGAYPVVYSNGIKNYHAEYKSKAPGVVTGRSGTIGQVTYVNQDYWPHNTSLWVTDFKGNYPKFVFYFLKNLKISRFNAGSGVPTLNRNDVHKQSVFVPPLPEQKAIASLLEKWDAAIEKTEALILAKEKRFKWLLKTLVSDQQNNPEWRKVKLGEIASLYQPKTIPKKDMLRNGQYKVFGANGVIGYYHKYNHEEAEIALACRGTCGIVNMTEPKSWITGNAMVVKPDERCVKKSYLYYFLSGSSLTACISGAAQPQITKQDLFHFQTIIPIISEQKQIAITLETAEREVELEKQLTEQYSRQRHGLMQKLLTGEWRLTPSFPRSPSPTFVIGEWESRKAS